MKEQLKIGDVTNYGRIEVITMGGHLKIEGRDDIVGGFRDIFKVNIKSEKEVQILTQNPII